MTSGVTWSPVGRTFYVVVTLAWGVFWLWLGALLGDGWIWWLITLPFWFPNMLVTALFGPVVAWWVMLGPVLAEWLGIGWGIWLGLTAVAFHVLGIHD
jgi:hypothetical protein